MDPLAQQFIRQDQERGAVVPPGPRDTQRLLPEDAIEAKRQLAIGLLERMPRVGVDIAFRLLLELKEYWSVREAHGNTG